MFQIIFVPPVQTVFVSIYVRMLDKYGQKIGDFRIATISYDEMVKEGFHDPKLMKKMLRQTYKEQGRTQEFIDAIERVVILINRVAEPEPEAFVPPPLAA